MVMSQLNLLSPNLVEVIGICLRSEELTKLLYYTGQDPLSQPVFNPSIIAPSGSKERVSPVPFDVTFKGEQRSSVHIYYPNVKFVNNAKVEQSIVWFDIIVHKHLWLYKQGNEKLVRPYEIASRIIKQFDGTIPHLNTVGNLNFVGLSHVVVNEEFNGVRLEALMTTF